MEKKNKKILFKSKIINLSLLNNIKKTILIKTNNSVIAIPTIKDKGSSNKIIAKFSFLNIVILQFYLMHFETLVLCKSYFL